MAAYRGWGVLGWSCMSMRTSVPSWSGDLGGDLGEGKDVLEVGVFRDEVREVGLAGGAEQQVAQVRRAWLGGIETVEVFDLLHLDLVISHCHVVGDGVDVDDSAFRSRNNSQSRPPRESRALRCGRWCY